MKSVEAEEKKAAAKAAKKAAKAQAKAAAKAEKLEQKRLARESGQHNHNHWQAKLLRLGLMFASAHEHLRVACVGMSVGATWRTRECDDWLFTILHSRQSGTIMRRASRRR